MQRERRDTVLLEGDQSGSCARSNKVKNETNKLSVVAALGAALTLTVGEAPAGSMKDREEES